MLERKQYRQKCVQDRVYVYKIELNRVKLILDRIKVGCGYQSNIN